MANGAIWAASPAETVVDVDVLVTMLAHPQAVEETALGEDGFLGALQAGTLWLDSSTLKPAFSRRMAAEA